MRCCSSAFNTSFLHLMREIEKLSITPHRFGCWLIRNQKSTDMTMKLQINLQFLNSKVGSYRNEWSLIRVILWEEEERKHILAGRYLVNITLFLLYSSIFFLFIPTIVQRFLLLSAVIEPVIVIVEACLKRFVLCWKLGVELVGPG